MCKMNQVQKRSPSALAVFLRLWVVLFVSFCPIKIIFNLLVMGWIDLRPAAFQEVLLVPLAQAVVFWLITRRARARGSASGISDAATLVG
jgi:hypothetical protein